MFNIILYQPEIPPNTGNIIRLCKNTNSKLHLIEPLGFSITDKHLKRAALDYRDTSLIETYPSYDELLAKNNFPNIYAISTKGKTIYSTKKFQKDDAFVFGPETRGLPNEILQTFSKENILRIPMAPSSRSLNLSNAAAILTYEAWRQIGFDIQ